MVLEGAVFLIAFLSGAAAYRLGRSRRMAAPQNPGLRSLAIVLTWFWLALSALLFAWAAARLLS
jgi:hypothetical protein